VGGAVRNGSSREIPSEISLKTIFAFAFFPGLTLTFFLRRLGSKEPVNESVTVFARTTYLPGRKRLSVVDLLIVRRYLRGPFTLTCATGSGRPMIFTFNVPRLALAAPTDSVAVSPGVAATPGDEDIACAATGATAAAPTNPATAAAANRCPRMALTSI
jgi:hypothetical protein